MNYKSKVVEVNGKIAMSKVIAINNMQVVITVIDDVIDGEPCEWVIKRLLEANQENADLSLGDYKIIFKRREKYMSEFYKMVEPHKVMMQLEGKLKFENGNLFSDCGCIVPIDDVNRDITPCNSDKCRIRDEAYGVFVVFKPEDFKGTKVLCLSEKENGKSTIRIVVINEIIVKRRQLPLSVLRTNSGYFVVKPAMKNAIVISKLGNYNEWYVVRTNINQIPKEEWSENVLSCYKEAKVWIRGLSKDNLMKLDKAFRKINARLFPIVL